MATSISNIVDSGAEGVAPTPQLTQGMSGGDALKILNQFNINPQDVLSASNIDQTINHPAPRPDDLLGIRKQIFREQGVDKAQSAWLSAQKATLDFQGETQQQNLDLGGRTVSMSKIVGTQGQNARVRQQAESNLLVGERLALQALNMKQASASEIFGIREREVAEKKNLMLQFPGADINFGDSFESVEDKVVDYIEEQEKKAEKKSYKEALRSMGIKTSGSRKSLEKRLRKANKKEYKRIQEMGEISLENARNTLAKSRAAARKASQPPTSVADLFGSGSGGGSSSGGSSFGYEDLGYGGLRSNEYYAWH